MGAGHAKGRAREQAATVTAESEFQREAIQRGEQTYSNILSLLGRPGTYGGTIGSTPALSFDTAVDSTTGVSQAGAAGGPEKKGIFEKVGPSQHALQQAGTAYGSRDILRTQLQRYLIDPDAATAATINSPSGRIASQLTAEAEQLINRQGPLYESMVRQFTSPILKSGSKMLEDSLEEIKRTTARGGRARREGLQEALKIQAQYEANDYVGTQLAQANANLDVWARQNAQSTLSFVQDWAANSAGVRGTYQNAVQAASNFVGTVQIPSMANLSSQVQALNQSNKTNWVEIGLGVATLAAGVITANPALIGLGTAGTAGSLANAPGNIDYTAGQTLGLGGNSYLNDFSTRPLSTSGTSINYTPGQTIGTGSR